MDEKTLIAKRVALELKVGDLVNLGIGLPTFVAAFVPKDADIFFQSENGIIGMVTVHVPPGRMQPIDSPMIFKGLAWRGGLPSDSVCDSLGTWNPKTNLT
jgi:hypothetical protein